MVKIMDECPNCKKWTLVYYPQAEANKCYTCGYTQKERYEDYIKRNDCAKSLVLPNENAFNYT
jgi:Zn ribbon nucleic-acid-binding protein